MGKAKKLHASHAKGWKDGSLDERMDHLMEGWKTQRERRKEKKCASRKSKRIYKKSMEGGRESKLADVEMLWWRGRERKRKRVGKEVS